MEFNGKDDSQTKSDQKQSRQPLNWVVWLLITLPLMLFLLLLYTVVRGTSQQRDEAVISWLYLRSTPEIHRIFQVITDTGGTGRNIPLLVALTLFWRKGLKLEAYSLGGAAVGAWTLSSLLKRLVSRTRPAIFETARMPLDASFPSGHTLGSLVVYGWLALWLWRQNYRLLAIVLLVWTQLIAFSRVYLGIHYPTDVLASLALGVPWLTFVVRLYNRRKERQAA